MKLRLLAAAAPAALVLSSLAVPGSADAAPSGFASPALGTVFTADPGNAGAVYGFAPGASGESTPVIDLTGPNTGFDTEEPVEVATARDGSIWVGGISGGVLHFAAGATGDVAPIQTISGPHTFVSEPTGIAVAADGSIWVANEGGDYGGTHGSVTHFAPHANGDATPLNAIQGASTGFDVPYGIALTPNGKHLWVIDNVGSLKEFPVTANGNVSPERVISGPDTGLNDAEDGIMVAQDGSIWAANPPDILHFAAHASGDAVPAVVTGAATGLATPLDINADAAGHVWVGNAGNGSITEYPANASGNTAYLRKITAAGAGLAHAWASAVYGFRPGKVRHLHVTRHHHKVKLRWKKPVTTGGAIGIYLGQRKTPHHHWTLVFGTGNKTAVDHSVKRGKKYVYRVWASNGYGYGGYQKVKVKVT